MSEICVPVHLLANAKEVGGLKVRPILLQFATPTDFGTHVLFMPRLDLLRQRPHPVLVEVLKLLDRSEEMGHAIGPESE